MAAVLAAASTTRPARRRPGVDRSLVVRLAAGAVVGSASRLIWRVAPKVPAAVAPHRSYTDLGPSDDGAGLGIVVNPGAGARTAGGSASVAEVLRRGLPAADVVELAEGDDLVAVLERSWSTPARRWSAASASGPPWRWRSPRCWRTARPWEVDPKATVGRCGWCSWGTAATTRRAWPPPGGSASTTASSTCEWSTPRTPSAVPAWWWRRSPARCVAAGLFETWHTTSVRVRSADGPLRLARDGETFDGADAFEIAKDGTRLAVFTPRR